MLQINLVQGTIPVCFRGQAGLFPEDPAEIALLFESAPGCDFRNGKLGGFQQLFAFLNTHKAYVCGDRLAGFLAEQIGKIHIVIKAAFVPHILDRHVGGNQQIFGFVNSQACQELVGRCAGALLEEIEKVWLADANVLGQVFEVDFFLIVGVHIGDGFFDIFVVGNGGVLMKSQKLMKQAQQFAFYKQDLIAEIILVYFLNAEPYLFCF